MFRVWTPSYREGLSKRQPTPKLTHRGYLCLCFECGPHPTEKAYQKDNPHQNSHTEAIYVYVSSVDPILQRRPIKKTTHTKTHTQRLFMFMSRVWTPSYREGLSKRQPTPKLTHRGYLCLCLECGPHPTEKAYQKDNLHQNSHTEAIYV